MGKHHEIRTGRSGGGSVRLHAVVEHGVMGARPDRLDRSDGVHLVPRLPQFSSSLLMTPICVIGGAPRAVRGPFPVRRP